MKKLVVMLLTAVIAVSAVTGCGTSGNQPEESTAGPESGAADEGEAVPEETEADHTEVSETEKAAEEEIISEGTVYNVFCLGEDFKNRVQDYYPEYVITGEDAGMIGETKVQWHLYTDAQEYREALDEKLEAQAPSEDGTDAAEAPLDERVDLFVVDEAFLRDYVETASSLDVITQVGLAAEELSDQFLYTQQMAADSDGRLKAVTWQATPGVFAYRRSIAKEVLGTDDPETVQEAVSDWERFAQTAEAAKENGYYMLSAYGDAYQVYADNVSTAWVEDGSLNIDPHLVEWAEQTREFAENGYIHGTEQWSDEWRADHTGDGEVFCFFYSSWGIRYTLQNKAEGVTEDGEENEEVESATGDYAVVKGPEPSHYGGQWIIAAAGSDNTELTASIMRALTCDSKIMKKIALDIHEFTNTVSGMKEIAESDYKADVLGGQNPVPIYLEVAQQLTQTHTTSYDDDLDMGFQVSMQDYFAGRVSLDDAIELFKKAAVARYEELAEEEEEEE